MPRRSRKFVATSLIAAALGCWHGPSLHDRPERDPRNDSTSAPADRHRARRLTPARGISGESARLHREEWWNGTRRVGTHVRRAVDVVERVPLEAPRRHVDGIWRRFHRASRSGRSAIALIGALSETDIRRLHRVEPCGMLPEVLGAVNDPATLTHA